MRLLVISNGHGEDIIACKIIQELLKEIKDISIVCLPLVGEGYAYQKLDIHMITPPQKMPSGGFIYMSSKQLWNDVRHGLIWQTYHQYKIVRQWAKKGGLIMAVGDILPLLFAYLSGINYLFVGTAKSEYYLRDDRQWLLETSKLERFWGSIYYPPERWLMTRKRCLAVFPRDTITTKVLQKYGINAYDFGNPMMDDLQPKSPLPIQFLNQDKRPLFILLLPGSREEEAKRNWQKILIAVENVINLLDYEIFFLAAISPNLDTHDFQDSLFHQNWQKENNEINQVPSLINDPNSIIFTKRKQYQIILTQESFVDCLHLADLAIAMAGTATEQFVGLGKPAIGLIGEGPQYTKQFAKNQARLLGISLVLVEKPELVGLEINKILKNPDFWQLITENGRIRMGLSGAAKRIALWIKIN